MTASEKTISSILKDLTNVHENLLSLSDDIWNSIDHNDAEKLDEGYAFKKEFNRLLGEFEKNKNDISVLVSQFTGVKLDEQPKIVEKDNSENQRLIKELNKNTPHEITEDFTFKRPTAFIFDCCAYPEMNCWSELYIQFVACLAKKDPAKLKTLADNPDFISKQNKKYYSASPKELRKPGKVMNDFFVETNRSANDLMKLVIDLLNYFEIPLSNMTIYLRQDRNA